MIGALHLFVFAFTLMAINISAALPLMNRKNQGSYFNFPEVQRTGDIYIFQWFCP